MNHYKVLGKLDNSYILYLRNKILSLADTNQSFQRVEFDQELIEFMAGIFENKELRVQYNPLINRYVQKAFVSSNSTYPIHKDGERCMSALNIAVECNTTDWVRWYSDKEIEFKSKSILINKNGVKTRNTDIDDIDAVNYLEQYIPEIGDIYTIDVNTFHTWKSSGPRPRIIIQTKFEGFPTFNTITTSLLKSSFIGISK